MWRLLLDTWDEERFGERPDWKPKPEPVPVDTRAHMVAKRCQRHNLLMEAVGIAHGHAAYFCLLGGDMQLLPAPR